MLKRRVRNILLSVFLCMAAIPAAAQETAYNAYSPYSMFGIGDISKQGSAYNMSMGGVGIATRDKRAVNYLNPASVTAREEKSFMADFSVRQGNRYYSQAGGVKSVNNTFNLYDVVLSFSLWKNVAMYGGFSPYSDIGYTITSKEDNSDIIARTGDITYTSEGYGGLSDLFAGIGVSPLKGFSLGAEYQHLFGNLHKNSSMVPSGSTYRSIYSGYNMNLSADTFKFGAQYEFPVGKKVTATLGATYKLGANLKGTVRDFEYELLSSVTDTTRINIDTLANNPGRVRISGELGLGIALKGDDKWTAEVNYYRSGWGSSGMDKVTGFAVVGNAVFSATNSQSLRAGFSICPNRNDIRYYRRTITYRAGAYWDQAYCKVDGSSVDAFGLTFGMTLPVYRAHNGVTLGVDIGQRGRMAGNLIRERYINFHIGLNIFDIWFLKPRYD